MQKEQILQQLIIYFHQHHHFQAQEVMNKFHLSRRNFYRYLDDLAELGVYIEARRGRNGGFKVVSDNVATVATPTIFSDKELMYLYFAIVSAKLPISVRDKYNVRLIKQKLLKMMSVKARKIALAYKKRVNE